jgi:hypothetical protein
MRNQVNHKGLRVFKREESSDSEEYSTRATSAKEFDGSNYEGWSTYIQNILAGLNGTENNKNSNSRLKNKVIQSLEKINN